MYAVAETAPVAISKRVSSRTDGVWIKTVFQPLIALSSHIVQNYPSAMAIRSQIERLEIAEIIFFCPAFFVSLYVCWRQGFGRQAGWIFLAVLSAIRVAGSACNVAAREGASDATGLMIASAVLNGIGLSFMITAVLRILERV